MKIRSTSVAALAAVPLALAGCAQGGGPATQPAPPPAPQAAAPSPEGIAWVGRMCGEVARFSEAQQKLPGVDKSNTARYKQSVQDQIGASAQAADDTVRGLQSMGPSPVSGADQVSDSFEQGFVQVRDILRTAQDKAAQADPTDRQRFQEGMNAVQQELDKGKQLNLDAALAKLGDNQELNDAAQQAPECKAFTQPQQPPQPQQQPPQ
ncbi:hypothetical protein [Saccharopolyspora taberi]|uniref:Small secreted protein n=1 Tax=Saccharopolyspora taberi TaxID=60895 RepID=A0ABN3VF56_9PSEU